MRFAFRRSTLLETFRKPIDRTSPIFLFILQNNLIPMNAITMGLACREKMRDYKVAVTNARDYYESGDADQFYFRV